MIEPTIAEIVTLLSLILLFFTIYYLVKKIAQRWNIERKDLVNKSMEV